MRSRRDRQIDRIGELIGIKRIVDLDPVAVAN
jgi:hypothetical protein